MTNGASPGSTRSAERITPPSPLRKVFGRQTTTRLARACCPGGTAVAGAAVGEAERHAVLGRHPAQGRDGAVGIRSRARCFIAPRSRAMAMTFGSNVRSTTESKNTRSPARIQSASVLSVARLDERLRADASESSPSSRRFAPGHVDRVGLQILYRHRVVVGRRHVRGPHAEAGQRHRPIGERRFVPRAGDGGLHGRRAPGPTSNPPARPATTARSARARHPPSVR